MGSILGPEMKKEGYDKEYGAAVNITSSTIGLIIPPSNVLIIYSLASGGVSEIVGKAGFLVPFDDFSDGYFFRAH